MKIWNSALLSIGLAMGIIKVAREVGVGNGTVQRIADEMHRPFVAA